MKAVENGTKSRRLFGRLMVLSNIVWFPNRALHQKDLCSFCSGLQSRTLRESAGISMLCKWNHGRKVPPGATFFEHLERSATLAVSVADEAWKKFEAPATASKDGFA